MAPLEDLSFVLVMALASHYLALWESLSRGLHWKETAASLTPDRPSPRPRTEQPGHARAQQGWYWGTWNWILAMCLDDIS